MTAPTIGVCGFGRCGSSLMMQMLAAGGVPMCPGSVEPSGELRGGSAGYADLTADGLAGTAVKLLDFPSREPLPPAAEWRFVWLDRDHRQQAMSTLKLHLAAGILQRPDRNAPADERLKAEWELSRTAKQLVESYRRDRPKILGLLRAAGPTVVLQYEQILANPRRQVRHLRRIAPDLDGAAAAAIVHDRDGRCRPDLTVELAGIEAAR